jgi:hypothetical protein
MDLRRRGLVFKGTAAIVPLSLSAIPLRKGPVPTVQCHAIKLRSGLSLSKGLSNTLGIISSKKKSSCARNPVPLPPSRFPSRVSKHDDFTSCQATATYAKPGFIVRCRILSARRIEAEFNKWQKLQMTFDDELMAKLKADEPKGSLAFAPNSPPGWVMASLKAIPILGRISSSELRLLKAICRLLSGTACPSCGSGSLMADCGQGMCGSRNDVAAKEEPGSLSTHARRGAANAEPLAADPRRAGPRHARTAAAAAGHHRHA